MVTKDEQAILLRVAHDAIAYGLSHNHEMHVDPKKYEGSLQEERASFVTLHLQGELRGCIGILTAYQPLVVDIAHNAHAAAFADPRFAPLTAAEFGEIETHISILNPAEEINFSSEEELISQLRPHVDGLILSDGRARGTFLPSVWEQLPKPRDFLAHLKLKAGLPASYWSDTINIKRYTTTAFP